ncbi:type II toxin-antitoxin system RelB/DinJ family antitoxin [Erwinia pyrifoliae]|uniref:type II toxin-antitoxin system RelB/DinJ family antitoxin n=1 Tax=Erwinia pyrifoliae TaxID=79967 RepID=UPI0034D96026
MATLNVRLDDKLKSKAYAVLDELDVSPTEAVRLLFQYIAENERLPLKTLTVSDEEDALLKTVRERLASPQKMGHAGWPSNWSSIPEP